MYDILLYLWVFYFGCIFGSFSTVLIDRWHKWTNGIFTGRSKCPHCHHILGFTDLFPLVSYLLGRWRCRYCYKKISVFYPLAEVMMWSIFLLLTLASERLGYSMFGQEYVLLIILGFVTGVYMLYDILYQEIPDQLLVPSIYTLLMIVLFFWDILPKDTFHIFHTNAISDRLIAAWALYTFFYIQIMVPGGLYLLGKRAWNDAVWLFFTYFLFPLLILKDLLWKSHNNTDEEEIPAWIGGGDLRIAIFIGLSLGLLHGIFAIFMAYIIWSIVGIGILLWWNLSNKSQKRIAFWPFLGIWWLISLLFWRDISTLFEVYTSYII